MQRSLRGYCLFLIHSTLLVLAQHYDAVPNQPLPTPQSKPDSADNSAFRTRIKSLKQPKPEDGSALKVHVGFFIESIGNIRETEMAYHLDIYMYQSWRDQSLAHNDTVRVINDQTSLTRVWVPDLYFANAKAAYFQTVTVPNFVMYINEDGTVAYSTRITMNLACNMDLKRYPMDSQICMVKIMSYAHTRKDMDVMWFSDKPLRYDDAIDLPEFYITNMAADFCKGEYMYAITETNGSKQGQFSCLLAKIYLQRAIGYHLVQTYIPTGMIVVISWVSFWIDPNAVPARVSLSFTTLLTLATQGAGLRYTLPPVSYAKAIDYWFGTCMLFLFAALLEFAVVNTLMRKAKKFEEMAQERRQSRKNLAGAANGPSAMMGDVVDYLLLHKSTVGNHYAKRALNIDKACRFIFPSIFGIFLTFYWVIYNM